MRCFSGMLALVLALVFSVTASAADKGKKKAKPVKGVITEVQKDADKNTGTITLKTGAGKKAVAAEGAEKKFKITEATKIDKVTGKKAEQQTSEAKFSDLQKGEQAAVVAKQGEEGVAATVHLVARKKKK